MEAPNKGADRYHRKGKDVTAQFNELARSIVEEVIQEKRAEVKPSADGSREY